jgi:hypothetical protein
MQVHEEGTSEKENAESTQDYNGRVFYANLTMPGVTFAVALRGSTAQQQDPQARQVPVADSDAGIQSRKPAPGQLFL